MRPPTALSSGLLALALLPFAAPSSATPAAAGESTICGWHVEGGGNPLVLAPAECPPWICPETPCSCCVDGAKFGLGVFNTPPGAGAIVLWSLGVAEFPIFGQTGFIDPSSIFAIVSLPPDPIVPDFANICWNADDCQSIPSDPGLVGVLILMQAASPDATQPGGWALSNRLHLQIGTEYLEG